MTAEEIKQAVIAGIQEVKENGGLCNRCCQYCTLTPQQHAEHHVLFQNAIQTRSLIWTVFVKIATIGAIGGVGAAVWFYIKSKIKGP